MVAAGPGSVLSKSVKEKGGYFGYAITSADVCQVRYVEATMLYHTLHDCTVRAITACSSFRSALHSICCTLDLLCTCCMDRKVESNTCLTRPAAIRCRCFPCALPPTTCRLCPYHMHA